MDGRYEEAIGLLYSEHSFTLTSLQTTHRFFTTVPTSLLSNIHTLKITILIPPIYLSNLEPADTIFETNQRLDMENKWLSTCVALMKMTGLRTLEIDLWNESNETVLEERMLGYFRHLRALNGGTFVVRLPWVEDDGAVTADRVRVEVGRFRIERRLRGIEPVRLVSYDVPPHFKLYILTDQEEGSQSVYGVCIRDIGNLMLT
jgi:hypothetical protein